MDNKGMANFLKTSIIDYRPKWWFFFIVSALLTLQAFVLYNMTGANKIGQLLIIVITLPLVSYIMCTMIGRSIGIGVNKVSNIIEYNSSKVKK